MAKWVAGCVYLAGIEARCGLGIADVSVKAGVSLYEVGAAAKRVAGLAAVGMERPAAHVCIERLVDRILGCALRCAAGHHGEAQGEGEGEGERPWILECISGPRRKKLRRARGPAGQCAEGDLAGDLLRFLGSASGRAARSRMVEMATDLAALGNSTGRTTGLGMGTVSGLAVSLALEHVCGWPLRHSQRLVLVRLVSLHAHVSAAHLMTHVEGTLRSLAADALRWVPWLREGEVDKDSVPAYFGDIVGCFRHSLIGGGADSESQLVADAPASVVVGGPPAFERARRLEACRRELLDGAGAGAGEELRSARDAGVDLPSVLSLPMHTLDEMKKSRERAAKRTERERRRLDDEEVGPEDMSDDEASAYLI
ncbi:hypothetical protein GGF37_004738 [Kickxella alabastrina]|nr:hypothetical protein GGF37_004738 [Kickxella alabastrina]